MNETQDFLSYEDCKTLVQNSFDSTTGGGKTEISILSQWNGRVRWARNRAHVIIDSVEHNVMIMRIVQGAFGTAVGNRSDLSSIRELVKNAEASARFSPENPDLRVPDLYPDLETLKPDIWSDATFKLPAQERGNIVQNLIAPAEEADMRSAGEFIVGARSQSFMTSNMQHMLYYPMTVSELSLTVRDAKGTASGWAGVNDHDFGKISVDIIGSRALEKCLRSRDPRAIEPGRYTTILEAQAVDDLVSRLVPTHLDRVTAERGMGPFAAGGGNSKIGQRVVDPRLSLSVDPMDAQGGFLPFDTSGNPHRPVHWIKDGVLRDLAYGRAYALRELHENLALPAPESYRLEGKTPPVSVDDMIKNTKRGILVTRFSGISQVDGSSVLCTGYTRDGLWLIQNGAIVYALKNFRFTESPLFAMNNVEMIGASVRVFHPRSAVFVPPLMVHDFNFSGLADAI